MDSFYFLIAGMMLVTFLPRLLPFYLIKNENISKKLKGFLDYIPVAVLGALIIPGIFTAIPDDLPAAFAGGIFAVIFSYYKDNILITVMGAIIVSYLFMVI